MNGAGRIDPTSALVVAPNAAVDRISVVKSDHGWPNLTATQTLVAPGGSGVHAARVAHALEVRVAVLGFAGGVEGSRLRQLLDQEGIEHALTPIGNPTRVNTVVVSASGDLLVELSERGPMVYPAEEESLVSSVADRVDDAVVLALSGSLPPGSNAHLYSRLVRLGRDSDTLVLVDAAGDALADSAHALPTLVKCNHRELQLTLGLRSLNAADTRGVAEALRRLLDLGAAWACATLGPLGALLVNSVDAFFIPAPDLGGTQPSGSGDAALGAITSALLWGASMPDAVRLGVAAGAVNTTSREVGVVSPSCVTAVAEAIAIQRLPSRK